MLRFVTTLTLLLSLTTATPKQFYIPKKSAASDQQISFAIENNYDDTGPGAKTREPAYKTFKNLEEALIGYINDKDTKLPPAERKIAIERLKQEHPEFHKPAIQRFLPKTVEEYTGYTKVADAKKQAPINKFPVHIRQHNNIENIQALLNPTNFRPVNSVPRYAATPFHNKDKMQPAYSYSYKVNDAKTGDQKSAQEFRDGNTVRGYYTLLDADGSTRIVKYKADDDGFHAVVDRTE